MAFSKLATMKQPLILSAVFSVSALVLLLVADLAVWGGYQGMNSREQVGALLLAHAAMLSAVFFLALLGTSAAFLLFRNRLPSRKVATLVGAAFAIVSFFALVTAFSAGGVIAAGARCCLDLVFLPPLVAFWCGNMAANCQFVCGSKPRRSLGLAALICLPISLLAAYYAMYEAFATGQPPIIATVFVLPFLVVWSKLASILPPGFGWLAVIMGGFAQLIPYFLVVHTVRLFHGVLVRRRESHNDR